MTGPDDETRHHYIEVGDAVVHVAETGDPARSPFVFLHGWPQSSRTWTELTRLAGKDIRALVVDLPGVGESTDTGIDGSKNAVATVVHQVIQSLDLSGVTLVGHDIGGMVAYAYLRAYQDVDRVVIMDVPVPGVAPWDEFLRKPFLWHFAFHSIAALPELLVQGRQKEYFDYFYNGLSADPAKISPEARASYVRAYASDRALTAGFNWYRAFPNDATENQTASENGQVATPLLYIRGDRERGGDIAEYVAGFREAGVNHLEWALVPGAGHFPQEENTEETWRLLARFAELKLTSTED